jgi:hypothetical protein
MYTTIDQQTILSPYNVSVCFKSRYAQRERGMLQDICYDRMHWYFLLQMGLGVLLLINFLVP